MLPQDVQFDTVQDSAEIDLEKEGLGPGQASARITPPHKAILIFRLLVWLFAIARVIIRLRFDRNKQNNAHYIREVVEGLGGPAIVFVRQFAMRIELMSLDIATELSRLQDSAPPMPLKTAFKEFNKYIKGKPERVFEVFDPETILSTHLDCVYQAVLRDSGKKVAVRIMRPGIPRRVHGERIVLTWLVHILGWMMPAVKDRLLSIKDELPFIEREIIDFVAIARLHRLMEKDIKRWRMKKRFHVAKVYFDYSSQNVIVSEFIEGYWLHEVLAAHENGDEVSLARLARKKINPKKCSQRLFEFGMWSMFESSFTLAAPRAGQFGVLPNNKLVIVQVGTTASLGRYQRRVYTTILQRVLQRDYEGIAELLIQLLAPLPSFDVHEFIKAVEHRIASSLIALQNKDAPTWQRSGTGVWVGFLEVVQSYGAIVPLELSRVIQSLCVFAELSFRLDSKRSLNKRLRTYLGKAVRRGAQQTIDGWLNPSRNGVAGMTSQPQQMQGMLAKANLSLESALENVPMTYLSFSKKSAHTAGEVLETLLLLTKITFVWLAVKVGIGLYRREEMDFVTELWQVVSHPAYLILISLVLVITARRVNFRLNDLDP